MSSEIQLQRVDRIKRLHTEIGGYLRMSLDRAIEIGGLLVEQKGELEHGAWLPWVKENLPFSERLARDYMSFWENREDLKTANLADLTEARKYLAPPPHEIEEPSPTNPTAGLLPDTECYRVTSTGIIFEKMISLHEWTELGRKLLKIKLPGEHEYFLIGDWLLFGEQMQYQAESGLNELVGLVMKEIPVDSSSFEDFIMLLAKRSAAEPRPAFEKKEIPKSWNYDESVRRMRIKLNMLKKHFKETIG